MKRRYFPPEVTRARANAITSRTRIRNQALAVHFSTMYPTAYRRVLEEINAQILDDYGPLPGDEEET